MTRSKPYLLLVAAGLTLATAACGGGSSSVTGPSMPAASTSPESGATIVGTVQSGATAAAAVVASSASGLRVTVTGTSLQTTTDNAGRFTLAGVPAGRAELHFEGDGVDARLEIEGLQVGQTLTVTVRVSGSNASRVEDGTETTLRAKVDSVGAGSLVVGGRTVRVDALTRLLDRNGGAMALSAFRTGDLVEVEGFPQPDGSLLAKKVKLEDDAADDGGNRGGDDAGEEVSFEGAISSLSPLVVAGRNVATDGSTMYLGRKNEPATAAQVLKVGNRVEVEGHARADNSVLAKKIKLED